ncbi:MAG: nicotinamide-nucleotide amidohydrolase family protein [Actinomycetota bacterium]|nr:nicotinamide-nucleotide amidohydrolase family protein [Actinomycetota bacterium]
METLALSCAVHERLLARAQTVACAESLTGGELAALLSSTSGASATFVGGVVSYATSVKQSVLQVPAETIAQHGVVSAACAMAMATGVRRLLGSDWAVATSGVAGPDSQENKPVGLVYVGIAGPTTVHSLELNLDGSRSGIRTATCAAALQALSEALSRSAGRR